MSKLKWVAISDTHTIHEQVIIPECDVLVHAGDFSSTGRPFEVESFLKWFNKQPATYKICISGNHDGLDDEHPELFKKMLSLYPDIIYLRDEGCEIEGIKIWGRPWTPTFYDWYFMADRGSPKMLDTLKMIPSDTDVILTHGPAFGILDRVNGMNVGCDDLLNELNSGRLSKLKMMIVGHIHDSNGYQEVNGILHVNAAVLNDYYKYAYKPKVITYDGNIFTIDDHPDYLSSK